jgi:hypothetical protein
MAESADPGNDAKRRGATDEGMLERVRQGRFDADQILAERLR